MTGFIVLAAILVLALLAPRYGADTRDLRDHPWESRRD
jgi:hypothetical protein